MTVGGFGMILLLSKAGFEAERLEDFKGLNQRNPWYAAVMLILMLSMAGIPPMLGFWAKWAVLAQVVQAGLVWLAIIAVIFAIIGVFYYLRVIKLMYFDDAEDLTPITANTDMHLAISANAILISLCLGALGVN
jgi:NADH-quinone oxidoreductase subunit N